MPYSAVEVSILIVSHNTREMTRAAIDSVVRETRDTRYEIIVVDNASGDGSDAMLTSHPASPRVTLLRENIGFARANNVAAETATGAYLLLLNPDTIVLDRAIDRLVQFAKENPHSRIYGGRTIYADGTLNPASCWGRMTAWNQACRATGLAAIFPRSEFFNGEAIGAWTRDRVRAVDIVSGCFLLIDTHLWRRLDGFDPRFFMYGEEADLCLRAETLGARPVITPEATIVHFGGASEKVRADKMVRLLAAKATLINRHWRRWQRPLGKGLLALWPATRAIATTIGALARPGMVDSAATWRTIWSRRSEWRDGYPEYARHDADGKCDPQRSAA